jgi:predicted transcriptional regulator
MPEQNVKYITSLKEIRVMNDPYRREIMTAMSLIDRPATAKDIADFMGEPPSKVNYHVGILHKYGFIDLSHTETINGIIAKFYKRSSSVFKIKIEGKNSQTKEIAALRDIVASTFDSARDRYIASVAKLSKSEDDSNSDKNDSDEGMLYSRKVYLSEDQVTELTEFIDRVSENKKGSGKMYELLVAFAQTEK